MILTLALGIFFTVANNSGNDNVFQSVYAYSYPKSSKIAMVPNANCANGGSLYTQGNWPNNDHFTFTNLAVANIENENITDPIVAGGYDTVMIMASNFDFGAAWSDPDFSGRIRSFVNDGGKLIIYGSEISYSQPGFATYFTNFIYPFVLDSPTPVGQGDYGTLTNLANDTLSSTDPSDESFVNIQAIADDSDIGDITVMTSYDTHWYIDLFGTNVDNVGGPTHTYAFFGSGLIIYNGLDLDRIAPPANTNGLAAMNMLWWRELSAQNLGPSANVNGLTLDPASAVNLVNSTHTVTATVRNTANNSLIPNVLVNFSITDGPNQGLTGQNTTDSSGQTRFSWTSSTVGEDTLTAAIPNSNPGGPNITTTAYKTWVIPGPLSVSVSPSNWTMDLNQTKVFTAIPDGGTLNYTSYQWYENGSALKNQIMPTLIFTPNSTGYFLITATVTDTNTTSPLSDNATVIVNNYPNITITPVGPLTMKTGVEQMFTANATGGSTPLHYQWNVSAAKVGTDNSTYLFVAGTSSVNVTCALTDSASDPVTVLSNTVLITVNGTGSSSSGGDSSSGGSSSSSDSKSSKPTPTPTPTETPTPTPTPTPPDQYPSPVFLFNLGWVEIAIITLMAIVLAVIIVVAFKMFK